MTRILEREKKAEKLRIWLGIENGLRTSIMISYSSGALLG